MYRSQTRVSSKRAPPCVCVCRIVNELMALAHAAEPAAELATIDVLPERLAPLLEAVARGEVASGVARQVLPWLRGGAAAPAYDDVIAQHGWTPLTADELRAICARVVADRSPPAAKALQRVRDGDHRAIRFFVGQVAKQTSGRADFELAERLLKELIE
jgi:Asp-tRNA(Asn)/Glu-tRNA(Gln) amidotransferase B subunit